MHIEESRMPVSLTFILKSGKEIELTKDEFKELVDDIDALARAFPEGEYEVEFDPEFDVDIH